MLTIHETEIKLLRCHMIYRSNKINNNDNIWIELNIYSPNGTADDYREIWLTHPNVIDNDRLRNLLLHYRDKQRQLGVCSEVKVSLCLICRFMKINYEIWSPHGRNF